MMLIDAHAALNLFTACSLLGLFIELIFRLIIDKSLPASFIHAFIFSPLYGLSLSIFLSIKPDSLLIASMIILFILLLLETIKRFILSCLVPKLPMTKWKYLFWTTSIWALLFIGLSECACPRLGDVIRSLPYSGLIICIYGLLYLVGVYFIERVFKELNQRIEELEFIHSARTQVQTAQNEILHGILELNIPQKEYLEAVYEECMLDMADLDRRYEEIILQLSPLQQKLIKAYLVIEPVRAHFILEWRNDQSG